MPEFSSELNKKHDVEQAVEMSYPLQPGEIFDIANQFGVDEEYVFNIIQAYESKKHAERLESLTDYVKDIMREYFPPSVDKRLPTFEEFFKKFNTQTYDERYTPEEVKTKFIELTQNPNQLSLFEVRKMIREIILESFIKY